MCLAFSSVACLQPTHVEEELKKCEDRHNQIHLGHRNLSIEIIYTSKYAEFFSCKKLKAIPIHVQVPHLNVLKNSSHR
jgi:hypothetical protein